ncbi:hypothetical protein HanRHA438_Chr10g0446861 [Helianthus annuus]|nr:hypothetical protein HanIR_Chr10g0468691 [Helianthus annuus]KAJ0879049.1 hypothetical protein HanRHA438_Chr10g0446861 [Helianthus annuus]
MTMLNRSQTSVLETWSAKCLNKNMTMLKYKHDPVKIHCVLEPATAKSLF